MGQNLKIYSFFNVTTMGTLFYRVKWDTNKFLALVDGLASFNDKGKTLCRITSLMMSCYFFIYNPIMLRRPSTYSINNVFQPLTVFVKRPIAILSDLVWGSLNMYGELKDAYW